MAKKSHAKSQSKSKAKSRVKVTSPAKAAPKTAPIKKVAVPTTPVPEVVPPPELNKILLSPLELAALILGVVALVTGVLWLVLGTQTPEPAPPAKNQVIPMTIDDFKGDPALENAIQKQLGGKSDAAPTPQAQPAEPAQGTNNQLQPTATGLQAR